LGVARRMQPLMISDRRLECAFKGHFKSKSEVGVGVKDELSLP